MNKLRREKTDVLRLVAALSISAVGLALLTFLMSRQTDEAFASSKARTNAVALFDSKCAMCHGKDGRGTKFGKAKGAPDFTNSEWQKSHADEQIKSAVANGRGKSMPAWKDKLSPEEIISLVGRVRKFAMKQ
ncbi:MAG: c-type cytochrome [Acidobacteriota bacterium]|nr:c-type cytochrome [Acidobacteriota bacterium]